MSNKNEFIYSLLFSLYLELSFIFLFFPCSFLCSSVSKESSCSAGDLGLIPGSGRSPGEGNGNHSRILAWKTPWTEAPSGLQGAPGGCKSLARLSN